jgi:hypothetical protein
VYCQKVGFVLSLSFSYTVSMTQNYLRLQCMSCWNLREKSS